jgi:hypothetical protein
MPPPAADLDALVQPVEFALQMRAQAFGIVDTGESAELQEDAAAVAAAGAWRGCGRRAGRAARAPAPACPCPAGRTASSSISSRSGELPPADAGRGAAGDLGVGHRRRALGQNRFDLTSVLP